MAISQTREQNTRRMIDRVVGGTVAAMRRDMCGWIRDQRNVFFTDPECTLEKVDEGEYILHAEKYSYLLLMNVYKQLRENRNYFSIELGVLFTLFVDWKPEDETTTPESIAQYVITELISDLKEHPIIEAPFRIDIEDGVHVSIVPDIALEVTEAFHQIAQVSTFNFTEAYNKLRNDECGDWGNVDEVTAGFMGKKEAADENYQPIPQQ